MSRETTNLRLIKHEMSEKILDINETDNVQHVVSLRDIVPSNTVFIIIQAIRISGTGNFYVHPWGGTLSHSLPNTAEAIMVGIKNQSLRYRQSQANDNWDIYCYGCLREFSMMQRDIR